MFNYCRCGSVSVFSQQQEILSLNYHSALFPVALVKFLVLVLKINPSTHLGSLIFSLIAGRVLQYSIALGVHSHLEKGVESSPSLVHASVEPGETISFQWGNKPSDLEAVMECSAKRHGLILDQQ